MASEVSKNTVNTVLVGDSSTKVGKNTAEVVLDYDGTRVSKNTVNVVLTPKWKRVLSVSYITED